MHANQCPRARTHGQATDSTPRESSELRIFSPPDDSDERDRLDELASMGGSALRQGIAYLPTRSEITEACLSIQAGWCDEERHWRSRGELYRALKTGYHHDGRLASAKGGAR